MRKYVETSAKTVEEAVRKALAELNAAENEVSVEVLEEESGGFLGIGAKARVRVSLAEPADAEETDVIEVVESETSYPEEVSAEAPETDEADEPEAGESEEAEDADDADETEETAEAGDEVNEEEKLHHVSESVESFLTEVLKGFNLEKANRVTVKEEAGRIVADITGNDCGILIGRKGETLHALQYLTSLVANKSGKSRMRVSLDIGGYKAKRENSVAALAVRTAQRAVRTGQAYELTPMTAAERRVVHEALQGFKGVTTYSEGDEPNRYVVIDLVFDDEVFSDEDDI